MSAGIIEHCKEQHFKEQRSPFAGGLKLATGKVSSTAMRATALVAIGIMLIPIDNQISQWLNVDNLFGEAEVFLNRIEPFGHAYGILMIALTLWAVGRVRLNAVYVMLGAGLGAGIAADVIKLVVCRYRPMYVPSEMAENFFTGFHSVGKFYSWEHLLEASHRSFPSAHTATAFGFAVALTALFPRGQRWFFFLAGLVAFQRIATSYHFASDICVGAATGIVIGTLVCRRFQLQAVEPEIDSRQIASG